MPIRIVLADDHPVFREGLRSLLARHAGFEVVGEAADGVEALRVASALIPDVLLVDQLMPGMTGTEVVRDLSSRGVIVRTIVLTADITRADIVLALRAGARGIVLKDVATELLLKGIRAVHGGQVWVGREVVSDVMRLLSAPPGAANAEERFGPRFTAREREVVRLVVECETNRRIAARMGIGEDTVKHHLTSIFDKSGASSRMELARFAIHHQWIQSEPPPP